MNEIGPDIEQEKDEAWAQLPTSIRNRVEDGAYSVCNWFDDFYEQLRYVARMADGSQAWRQNPARAYLEELREQLDMLQEAIETLRDDPMLDPNNW